MAEMFPPEFLSDKNERHRFSGMVLSLSLARQVKALRSERKWTQERLAKESGVAQQTISAIERAAWAGTVATLRKIARACDVALIVRFDSWKEWLSEHGDLMWEAAKNAD